MHRLHAMHACALMGRTQNVDPFDCRRWRTSTVAPKRSSSPRPPRCVAAANVVLQHCVAGASAGTHCSHTAARQIAEQGAIQMRACLRAGQGDAYVCDGRQPRDPRRLHPRRVQCLVHHQLPRSHQQGAPALVLALCPDRALQRTRCVAVGKRKKKIITKLRGCRFSTTSTASWRAS